MELDPNRKTPWRFGSQGDADIRMEFDRHPASDAEIRYENGRYILKSVGGGPVCVNQNELVEMPLPDSCYIWFGDHRYRWKKPFLTYSPRRGYLYLRDLKVRKGNKTILQNLTFGIAHDTGMVGIFGPSGCGKSTFIKELLKPPGEDDNSIIRHPDCSIGYVPQEDTLPSYLTVAECLEQSIFFREPSLTKKAVKKEAEKLLELIGLDDSKNEQKTIGGLPSGKHKPVSEQKIGELSGGQRKRVSLAMELSGEPDILLLDEPTTGLDPRSQKVVMIHLLEISRKRDITVICVTHALETMDDFNQIVILRPLSKEPAQNESSLCYAGPNNKRGEANAEVCRIFGLENINEIFLPDQHLRPPDNHTPDPDAHINHGGTETKPEHTDPHPFSKLIKRDTYFATAKQSLLITKRSILQVSRNRASLFMTLALPIVIGFLIFLAEGRTSEVVESIRGQRPGLFLFSGITGLWLGMTLVIRTIVSERAICARDRRTELTAFSYGLGKILFLLIGAILQVILLTGTLLALHLYAPFGLLLRIPWPDPSMVFVFAFGLFLMIVGGGFLGLAVSACARKEFVAVSFLPLLMIPHLMFNKSTYETDIDYHRGSPYIPLISTEDHEDFETDRSIDYQLHSWMSLPLLSRPFLNVMEGTAAHIQNEKSKDDKKTVRHPSHRYIIESQADAFDDEWWYFIGLWVLHGALAVVFLSIGLPRKTEVF